MQRWEERRRREAAVSIGKAGNGRGMRREARRRQGHLVFRSVRALCGRDVFGAAKEVYSVVKHRRGMDGWSVAKAERGVAKNGKAKEGLSTAMISKGKAK